MMIQQTFIFRYRDSSDTVLLTATEAVSLEQFAQGTGGAVDPGRSAIVYNLDPIFTLINLEGSTGIYTSIATIETKEI